jgi:2-C-methyl-D-erythritol 4-phosphate cytidylyltransferase
MRDGKELTDLAEGNRAARFGVTDTLVNGGQGRFVLVSIDRNRFFEVEFPGLGHIEMLEAILRGCHSG